MPLVWGMLHGSERDHFDLSFCLPAECADRLSTGAADIGIVPSIELARQGLEIIPGTGIACQDAVRSILLITKVPPDRIRTLATDSSSRTSVVLARIILARRYGAEPRAVSMPPDLPVMLEAADAALVIGDPALRIEPSHLPFAALDLGSQWRALTGLPMVFAVWGGRKEIAAAPGMAELFASSCRYGLAHLDEIAAREGPARGLSEALAREYFARNLTLELGAREYEGLRLFLNYAREFDNVVSKEGVIAS